MPKSSKEQINEDEKKLLKMLQFNSGDSIENIAKISGFSRQKVWRIKKRFEKDKTIWGYNAIVDDIKLGVTRYIMLIKTSAQPVGGAIHKIIDLTVQKKGEDIGIDIISGSYLHGRYDWLVIFTAKGIHNAIKLKEILFAEYPQLIIEAEIMEYIFPLKDGGIINPEIEKIREFF